MNEVAGRAKSNAARALKYRPEIDGLRAVAVLPVVLFHVGLGFPGGFVGVDVFFVISGYLITSLLLKEGEGLSLVKFWERRFRRIAPAATVMTLACLVTGWLLLLPRDFTRLGRSVTAQALLVSNIYFWRDLNYFATDEVRPLLHTWSLAVEEQFYLILPLFIYVLRRAPRRVIAWSFAVAAAVSLAASVEGVREHPSATFYLLPSRAWELLIGSLIATLTGFRVGQRWVAEALSGAGLIAILVAASCFSADTRFPGEAALVPCLGAAAVIVGTAAIPTFVGRVLSSQPFVWLGACSYSLYLWHWPLLAFTSYRLEPEGPWRGAGLVAVSLLLAWVSWRFVEQPVRKRAILAGRRQIFAGAALAALTFVGAGATIVRAGGVPSRWLPSTLRYADGKLDADFRTELELSSLRNGEIVRLGVADASKPIELLVWGDSHAMAILHVVDFACRERRFRCAAATHSATAPLLDFPAHDVFSLREQAVPFARAVVDFVRERRVPRVLLAAVWSNYVAESAAQFQADLAKTASSLREAGARVEIVEDVPFPSFDVPIVLANADASGADVTKIGIKLASHLARNADANRIIGQMASDGVLVLDPTPWFDDGAGLCRVESDRIPLYFDKHHLSTFGAMRLKPLIERALSG